VAHSSYRIQRPSRSGPAGLAILIAIAALLTLVLSLGFVLLFGPGRNRSANPLERGPVSTAAVVSRSAAPTAPVVLSGLI